MQRLSKPFFLISLIVPSVIAVILTMMMTQVERMEDVYGYLAFIVIMRIYTVVISSLLWFKCWESIQDDGRARMTPKKAVGFLFIPVFNFYWIFQAIVGFVTDFNEYRQRHNLGGSPLSFELALVATILGLIGIGVSRIPVLPVSLTYSVIVSVVGIILVNQFIDAANVAIDVKDEITTSQYDYNVSKDNMLMGIVAILLGVQAFIYEVVGPFLYEHRILDFFLMLYYWGLIIFLGFLCKHPVLRWFAIGVPTAALVFRIFMFIKYVSMA